MIPELFWALVVIGLLVLFLVSASAANRLQAADARFWERQARAATEKYRRLWDAVYKDWVAGGASREACEAAGLPPRDEEEG